MIDSMYYFLWIIEKCVNVVSYHTLSLEVCPFPLDLEKVWFLNRMLSSRTTPPVPIIMALSLFQKNSKTSSRITISCVKSENVAHVILMNLKETVLRSNLCGTCDASICVRGLGYVLLDSFTYYMTPLVSIQLKILDSRLIDGKVNPVILSESFYARHP